MTRWGRPAETTARGRAASAAALLAVAALALAACGGSGSGPAPTSSAPEPTSSGSPSTSPSPTSTTPSGVASPLTGLPVAAAVAARPATAVVVGMTGGHAATGIAAADIVYVEFDRRSHARLVGVFQTADAAAVGPVVATAPVDPRLLTLFSMPVYGFDGGPSGFVVQAKAPAVIARDAARYRTLYHSGGGGLTTSTAALRASAPAGATPLAGALTFASSAAPAPTGGPALHRLVVSVPGQVAMAWAWNGTAWAGPSGSLVSNVIVQYVSYKMLTPHKSPTVGSAQVVGAGPAAVYAGQHAAAAVWQRAFTGVVTVFRSGVQPVGLAPGRTWVLLVPRGTRVVTS